VVEPAFGSSRWPDRFCTGSSIMPQKKNPDVPELVRGKSGRVVGHLVALLVLMKAQPLTYNKDNQEDKEPLFDTVDTLADTLAIMTDLVATGIAVNASACARRRAKASQPPPISPTTSCAAAHRFGTRTKAVARAVRHAESEGRRPGRLVRSRVTSVFAAGGRRRPGFLTLEGSVASRDHPGGTAPAQVRARQPPPASRSATSAIADGRRTHDALGLLAGALTTIAFVPQVVRIVRTRSAYDISWGSVRHPRAGLALWLWYGIVLRLAAAHRTNVVTLAADSDLRTEMALRPR
jgi:uncharacterized protein with PQ loop repeat